MLNTIPSACLDSDPSAARYLFQVRNRRGLGHMMRGLNIATALRKIDPQAQIGFHLRCAPAEGFWPADFAITLEDSADARTHWEHSVAQQAPDVLIYDTLLPDRCCVLPAHTQQVFVMRKCLPDEQQAVYAHPVLVQIDTILIPHTREQFGSLPPPHVAGRCHFVGPIVRRPRPEAQAALRRKYGLKADDFVLTSTVGGGGFEAQADRFFATVAQVHAALQCRQSRLRHLVVQGPNYTKTLPQAPGMTVIDFEPDLVDLLALSDLVIAEGGYNTVNEILTTGTPAIFLPSVRGKDDQFERVQVLADAGRALVFDATEPGSSGHIAAAVHTLQVHPERLQRMRERAHAAPTDAGNERAARHLAVLGLIGTQGRGVL
jgi:predicted glycosyltransferase